MTPTLPSRRRKPIKAAVKTAVYSRHGHRCAYCGGAASHLDHLVPWSRWGSDLARNLRPCCRPCGEFKGAMTPIEWLGRRCPDDIRRDTEREERAVEKLHRRFAAAGLALPRRRAVSLTENAREQVAKVVVDRQKNTKGPGGPGGRTTRRVQPLTHS